MKEEKNRNPAKERTEKGRETKNMQGNHLSKMGIAPLISCRLRSLVPLGTCLEKEYEKAYAHSER
jgi:hypothetical protein